MFLVLAVGTRKIVPSCIGSWPILRARWRRNGPSSRPRERRGPVIFQMQLSTNPNWILLLLQLKNRELYAVHTYILVS